MSRRRGSDDASRIEYGDPKFTEILRQVVLESFVENGDIVLADKSDSQIAIEFWSNVRVLKRSGRIYGTIDHLVDLHRQAKEAAKAGNPYTACLFYSTWFEHWINKVLMLIYAKRRLSFDTLPALARETGLRAKYLSLPPLLGIQEFRKAAIDAVLKIAEFRNGFVHYKFLPLDMNSHADREPDWNVAISAAEKALLYFQNYYRRNMLGLSKTRIKQIMIEIRKKA